MNYQPEETTQEQKRERRGWKEEDPVDQGLTPEEETEQGLQRDAGRHVNTNKDKLAWILARQVTEEA